MTDAQKRQLFWLLKRFSSVTYWERFQAAYEPFVELYEEALMRVTPPGEGYVSDLKRFLDTAIYFERGIAKLRNGERFVFKAGHSERYLQSADEGVYVAWRLTDPDEYDMSWVPNFDTLRAAIAHAYTFARNPVLNNRSQPTRPQLLITRMGLIESNDIEGALVGPFPPNLAQAPAPADIEVPTGGVFPAYGIYQPYAVLNKKVPILGTVSKINEFGCMHYWLEGVEAPQSTAWETHSQPETKDVVWKLIWEDTRYLDGSVPEEEKDYFPETLPPPTPPFTTYRNVLPGEPCPKSGEWMVGHTPGTARRFMQGETMPELNLSTGATIWTFVGD